MKAILAVCSCMGKGGSWNQVRRQQKQRGPLTIYSEWFAYIYAQWARATLQQRGFKPRSGLSRLTIHILVYMLILNIKVHHIHVFSKSVSHLRKIQKRNCFDGLGNRTICCPILLCGQCLCLKHDKIRFLEWIHVTKFQEIQNHKRQVSLDGISYQTNGTMS